ncbi:MAG: hypothetical protein HY785_14535 [Oscillatoriophycideae cyanobacterium NC_groundwater_1537_Pr4_S-0.65um_50_18]|nr:hypothetical protein [Oscillatoriophycideae cyanobacterium NC_groundwater_1537_Pr4_S-0.65um_50_18]
MRSPAPPLIHDSQFFVSGDVTIHPTAAIAPGVLLQADPGCRLVVGAGVCVGIGALLHAHQGNLVIEAGVTLGSGVLIVGQATIGENACIGSAVTILNRSVEPQQLIASGTLVGDDSRQMGASEQVGFAASASAPTQPPSVPSPAEAVAASSSPEVTQVIYGRAYLEKIMVTMFPQRQSNLSPPENPTSG